jgi:hypothetical protein
MLTRRLLFVIILMAGLYSACSEDKKDIAGSNPQQVFKFIGSTSPADGTTDVSITRWIPRLSMVRNF